MSRYFKGLRDASQPVNVHYFSNPKSWMMSDVMLFVLKWFNRKLLFEQKKNILFLDNATCHLESMVDSFLQTKIIFLPKNTTSRLQPLDAGIIQNFRVKYKKRLVKYDLARINENSSATLIIKGVNILITIQWAQEACKKITMMTIKNCFEKFGVVKSNDNLMEIDEDVLEFETFVRQLSPICQPQRTFISTPMSQHLSLWSMSMKLTGEKGYEKIVSVSSQLKVMWERKHRKFQMMMMLKRRMISKMKESVSLNFSQCLTR